jgi:hypothetical protein
MWVIINELPETVVLNYINNIIIKYVEREKNFLR